MKLAHPLNLVHLWRVSLLQFQYARLESHIFANEPYSKWVFTLVLILVFLSQTSIFLYNGLI